MGNSQEPQDFNISVMPSSLTPVHVAKAAEGLNLYDTASHQVSHFVPLKPGEVGIYVCGATVQSSPHIGHIRAAVAFDIVRRWFLKLGYKVTFVRNVTDIDDKILVKAAAAGQRWWARAYYYEREFTEAYNTLGVLPPTVEPRATGHMSDMIDLIQRILDNGHGYVVTDTDGKPTGNVYFDVASWPHYGELTHQKQTSEVDEAAAVADRMGPSVDATGADKYNPVDPADASPDKHDPRDFALWKAPKDTDPEDARWSTPFGVGRPGWHIECSAMSKKHLGDTIDIHAGGQDLQFPHHENEIAQSECCNGVPFANYWMHNGYITIDNEKMSKSKGNFFTVRDILKDYDGEVIRFFLLSGHYRNPINFSDTLMEQAKAGLARMQHAKENLKHLIVNGEGTMTDDEKKALEGYDKYRQEFIAAMDDDLNTADAISAIFELITAINTDVKNGASKEFAEKCLDVLMELATVVGLLQKEEDDTVDADIQALVDERQEARKAKNFARADEIRDLLKEKGITLKDTPQGVQIIKE